MIVAPGLEFSFTHILPLFGHYRIGAIARLLIIFVRTGRGRVRRRLGALRGEGLLRRTLARVYTIARHRAEPTRHLYLRLPVRQINMILTVYGGLSFLMQITLIFLRVRHVSYSQEDIPTSFPTSFPPCGEHVWRT